MTGKAMGHHRNWENVPGVVQVRRTGVFNALEKG